VDFQHERLGTATLWTDQGNLSQSGAIEGRR
jgi:hypothetical protein